MATKSITLTKDNTSYQRYAHSDAKHEGRGENTRLLIGRLRADDDLRVRSFLDGNFTNFWDDVEEVTEAVIEMTFAGGGDLSNGNTGRVSVKRIVGTWSEHTNSTFSSGGYEWPSLDHNLANTSDAGSGGDGDPCVINCISILRQMAPKSVLFTYGGKSVNGLKHPFEGFALLGAPESDTDAAIQVWSSDHATSGFRPRLTIQYRAKNTQPNAGLVNPSGAESTDFPVTGTFQDDDDDDYMTKVEVHFRKDTADWDPVLLSVVKNVRDVAGEWDLGGFDHSKFKKGQTYHCRARVADSRGKWSDWAGPNSFTITATSPTVTATPLGTQPTMDGVVFSAPWTVDPATEIVRVDILLGSVGFTTPLWQFSYPPTSEERDASEVQAIYQGPGLAAGSYEWRVRVTDALGASSSYSIDDTLVLSVGMPDDESDLVNTTVYSPIMPSQRIVLYRMRSSDRGPGTVVGIIEDATNIGCSWYATAPGELYFTLPVTHPQVSVVEPMTTHYSFQQYRQGRWKELAAGLIRDFDARDDDMVVYGIDYLGLLSMSIEAAKQNTKDLQRSIPTKVDGVDGARYYQKTIRTIIVDQLKRARLQDAQSPVKFIQTGRIDSFSTKVTIYASFAERLSFIRGLIDSHKGGQANGEERRSRLRVRWNPAASGGVGAYQFEALDAVGQDRDNLRLEYGGLIQGYRVIALDEFATMVYGIGRIPNHTLPAFAKVNAPGISQADWGSVGRASFWNDVVDSSDLTRRARNLATRMSRIGKRIALGIRVSGILPFDGYDILDNVPIVIEDGVVSTSQYGSGYWTIWGCEYRVYPDEHDEMTLILRPRGDSDSIDSDLIPSQPIHFAADLVWGSGPP